FYGKDGARGISDDGVVGFPTTDTIGNFKLDEGSTPVPFVDMGVAESTSGIGIGFLSDHAMLDLQLSAMEKSGNGEVVSQPKVV
ncbi:type IV pilus secretin PilQ, partial [Pseudomonas sp. ATCC 13867]